VNYIQNHYTLTIGAAIFTCEGIGLILPIQSSMANPDHFEPLLGLVMLLITVVFTSVGALCYATFSEKAEIKSSLVLLVLLATTHGSPA
jgi:proton-coupled amino acid transporter